MFDNAWKIRLDTLTHLNALSHLPISIAKRMEGRLNGSPNMWNLFDVFDSLVCEEIYRQESRDRETEILTKTVKFINLVLVSDPLDVAPIFKSARNSGKLRKQSARRASSPSLISFLSSAWSCPRRDSRSSQCGWSDSKPSYADKATKLYLCNAFLIRVRSCVKTELNNFRIGANKIPYAYASTWGPDKGLSSFKSLYSSCYANDEI